MPPTLAALSPTLAAIGGAIVGAMLMLIFLAVLDYHWMPVDRNAHPDPSDLLQAIRDASEVAGRLGYGDLGGELAHQWYEASRQLEVDGKPLRYPVTEPRPFGRMGAMQD